MKKIALLGGTGYIGKSLIYEFLKSEDSSFLVYIYVRSIDKVEKFIKELNFKYSNLNKNYQIRDINDFGNDHYDVIINCIGMSDPNLIKQNPREIFGLTEYFDNKIMDYLEKNNSCLSINFSSGSVYGRKVGTIISDDTFAEIDVNNIKNSDIYSIAKINSEAKHRSNKNLNIIDLRMFAFFSQFVDVEAGFLMSEISKCLVENQVFKTTSNDIVRDFIGPEYLYDLILFLINAYDNGKISNDVYDIVSKSPVSKLELLDFLKNKYHLNIEYSDQELGKTVQSATGEKNMYCSNSTKLEKVGFKPIFTSLECIDFELEKMLTIK